jgi:hypothetical protein
MAERWAHCDECLRWFGCTHQWSCTLQVVCPACAAPVATVIEGDPTRVCE